MSMSTTAVHELQGTQDNVHVSICVNIQQGVPYVGVFLIKQDCQYGFVG